MARRGEHSHQDRCSSFTDDKGSQMPVWHGSYFYYAHKEGLLACEHWMDHVSLDGEDASCCLKLCKLENKFRLFPKSIDAFEKCDVNSDEDKWTLSEKERLPDGAHTPSWHHCSPTNPVRGRGGLGTNWTVTSHVLNIR